MLERRTTGGRGTACFQMPVHTDRPQPLLGDWFPDEFGNVDHEVGALPIRILRRADLIYTHAHHVIEAAAAAAVAEVKMQPKEVPPAP